MLIAGNSISIPDPIGTSLNVGVNDDIIAIEPASQRVRYHGASRPQRRVAGRTVGTTATLTIGADGSHAWSFSSSSIQKQWVSFGPLPAWVDSEAVIVLKVLAGVPSSLSDPNATAQFFTRLNMQRVGTIPSAGAGQTVDYNFDSGAGYTASTLKEVTLYSATAGTMASGDILTAAIQRTPTATEDTVSSSLLLLDACWLEVTQKEAA